MVRGILFLLWLTFQPGYGQVDTIFAETGVVYKHEYYNYFDTLDKWVYVVETGNACGDQTRYTIDVLNFDVPDHQVFYDGDQSLVFDPGLVGGNCPQYTTLGSQCRPGFFTREEDGTIVEMNFPPWDYTIHDSIPVTFSSSMGYRVIMSSSQDKIYIEAIPNNTYHTVFLLYIHPTVYSSGGSPVVIYSEEDVCDESLVGIDTIRYGEPCDSIEYITYVYNEWGSTGVDWDTTILYGSGDIEYVVPDWLSEATVDGVETGSVYFSSFEDSSVEVWGCAPNGCCGYATISVNIYYDGVYIPNVFSPNGDGSNDTFDIYTKSFARRKDITIFDRWGGLIYKGEAPWYGMSRGKVCDPGVYIYLIEVEIYNTALNFSGDITIVK